MTRIEISDIAQLNVTLQEQSPQEILNWVSKFDGVYQTTSFGLTGLVIMDMLAKSGSLLPVIFIDTLHSNLIFNSDFQETYELIENVKSKYSPTLHIYKPEGANTVKEFTEKYGQSLWKTDSAKYDYLVKAEPGRRANLELGAKIVLTGRRRSQGAERSQLPIIELDNSYSPPLIKINPLAAWDYNQVWSYVKENNVPYNVLHDRGYKSIGDSHSTTPTAEGESERDGRWRGQEKTECGLHKDYFKLKRLAKEAEKRKALNAQ
ncbi:hypothetical protein HDV04_003968 [Boothiomyces sp. JEL0838]|nr:hypothetical protein HDV04_003968 [Boothiomyces sp. JEL0838]